MYNIRLTDSIYTSELALATNHIIATCNSLPDAIKIAETYADGLNLSCVYQDSKLHTIVANHRGVLK